MFYLFIHFLTLVFGFSLDVGASLWVCLHSATKALVSSGTDVWMLSGLEFPKVLSEVEEVRALCRNISFHFSSSILTTFHVIMEPHALFKGVSSC